MHNIICFSYVWFRTYFCDCKCNKCNYRRNFGNLREHKRIYHDKIKLKFEMGTYEVFSSSALRLHKNLYEDLKGHQSSGARAPELWCPRCSWLEGIRYICNTCNLAVVSFKSLENHKKNKHEGIRYDCPKCDYKATMRGNLKIHIQAMHEGLGYHCNQCSYKASTPRSLKLHEKSKHVIWTMYKVDIYYKFENQSEKPFTYLKKLPFTYFLTF